MGNLCSFSMKIIGEMENMKKFCAAMRQDDDIWMGRGADISVVYNGNEAYIDGSVNCSLMTALVLDAMSMRAQKETGKGNWAWDEMMQETEYITLYEACEKHDLKMEAFSEEPADKFAEHLSYSKEYGPISERTYYEEQWIDTFDSKEAAEKALNTTITDDDWKNGLFKTGGYDLKFNI